MNFAAILHGLASVMHTMLSASSIDPATKEPLVQKLTDIKSTLADAIDNGPAYVGKKAETLTGDAMQLADKAIPAAAPLFDTFGPEFEALANVIATTVASHVESVFVSHNKNTLSAILEALPSKVDTTNQTGA
jgi:hypothetical protein